ncbi:MAG TPA: HEAT repeat domain-containing protein [Niabella sp.]
MKKDILKEFVSENRDDFDDQEPDLDVLSKIQSRLGLEQPVVASRAKVIQFQYWRVAAAIIVVIIGVAVFFPRNKTMENAVVNKTAPGSEMPIVHTEKKDSIATLQSMAAGIGEPAQKQAVVKKRKKMRKEKNATAMDSETALLASGTKANDWRKELQSESSSARLAAVLASGKKEALLSSGDLQTLFNTMNNDENSNVRLAALEVLKKQENRETVKNLILQSVAKQDDPVVQMELLASLSSGEATRVKQQLLDITQNPINIDAVRNEAYAALLRSKANF